MATSTTSRLPLALLSHILLLSSTMADPLVVKWSDRYYGPDGPWPAVEVGIGLPSQQQTIALYPGREFASFVLTTDYCNNNKSLGNCYSNNAGVYNEAASQLAQSGSDSQIQYEPGPDYMFGVNVTGDKATSWVDYWQISGTQVANVSMALLDKAWAQYPGGNYPLSVGCMGYGAAKTVNQTFSMLGNTPPVNASLIPGYLSQQKDIASNSFGMHIGSANPRMPGSFYYGGYDQNRIVGDILTNDGSTHDELSLKDISIEVIDGASPWNFTSLGGILAAGNSSISSGGISVIVDGCSPYLTFPKSTCDALASHLPVTFNSGLGLYTWNTNDVKYSQIVNSASALKFTFLAGSNTKNVSISVPFRHLNLTLDQPLVQTPTQYFPCYTGPASSYTLGRAFLQDAFIGANWAKNTWWLAQAPGPGIPSSASVTEIGSDASTIKASQNDWKASWTGSWKALTTDEINSGQSVNSPDVDTTGSTGLSTGAKAGMGVGIAVGALAIIGLAIFFWRRHKKDAAAKAGTGGAGAGVAEAGSHEKTNSQYQPNPQQNGFYAPVKDANGQPLGSPYGGSHDGNTYYNQQPYGGQYQGYQQAPQELVAVGNTPSELPASSYNPSLLGDHPSAANTYHSPQSGYSHPDSGTMGSMQSNMGYQNQHAAELGSPQR